MGILCTYGAETGAMEPYRSAGSGTNGVQATTKRTGAYAFYVTNSGSFIRFINQFSTSTGLGLISTVGGTIYFTGYFYLTALPAADAKLLGFQDSGNSGDQASIYVKSTGELEVYDANDATVAATTATCPTNTWFRIEFQCVNGAADGSFILNLYQDDADGSSPDTISATGTEDFREGAATGWGRWILNSWDTATVYFDDGVLADDAFYPGKIELMLPVADGTDAGFDAGAGTDDYTSLDEIPANTTDYLVSDLSDGDAETPALESAASAGISGTINAVLALAYTRKDGVNGSFNIRVRTGSGTVNTSNFVPPFSFGYSGTVQLTNPGGGAWSATELDALEVGIVNHGTGANERVRLSAANAEVHFTEAAAGAAGARLVGSLLVNHSRLITGRLVLA